MPNKKYDEQQRESAASYLIGDFIIDASDEEVDELIKLQGGEPFTYIEDGKNAIKGALKQFAKENNDCKEAHLILGKLLTMLRRREKISEEELSERARIDVKEIRKIEHDRDYSVSPRTIIQLENYFNLPAKTLAKLSGAFTNHTDSFWHGVIRFAAKMKTIDNLNSEEKELLKQFINFLSSHE